MPVQNLCTVVERVQLNPYAVSMTLEAGAIANSVSHGQFVHIKCGDARLLRRPISVCDWQENLLRIVFEVRGEGTAWLAARKPGEKLDLLGPLGKGFDISGKKLLLVGGGVGVPPLLACARTAGVRSTAVLGFRSADRVMLAGDFEEAHCPVTLCTDDGSLGKHGFVDGQVRELLKKGSGFTDILACGPKPMLRSVARAAADFGVSCQVSMEERMGCGVGACLVCACKMQNGTYKHVCKDGPVFNAAEVDWNE